MPNSDKLQPDFNQDSDSNHKQKSLSLSRDISDLQNGIKIDFDQKLNELGDLLQRFKALIISPNQIAAQDAANEPNERPAEPVTLTNPIKNLPDKTAPLDHMAQTSEDDEPSVEASIETPIEEQIAAAPVLSTYSDETARFENGLYKLNSQLYRFRLELDQELEFREEPLHVHFNQPSDLSEILQKLSDVEKHPGN